MVAGKLQAMIGLPVDVSSVSLCARSSSLKFRILDPKVDPASPQAAILSVDSATTDLSLAELVSGQTSPKEIHISGLELALRLDAKGNLQTSLPEQTGTSSTGGEIPTIILDGGRLRIRARGTS